MSDWDALITPAELKGTRKYLTLIDPSVVEDERCFRKMNLLAYPFELGYSPSSEGCDLHYHRKFLDCLFFWEAQGTLVAGLGPCARRIRGWTVCMWPGTPFQIIEGGRFFFLKVPVRPFNLQALIAKEEKVVVADAKWISPVRRCWRYAIFDRRMPMKVRVADVLEGGYRNLRAVFLDMNEFHVELLSDEYWIGLSGGGARVQEDGFDDSFGLVVRRGPAEFSVAGEFVSLHLDTLLPEHGDDSQS